uniref:Ig-like domain-containing protein n=1 Tax=Poecilia latipinna TaxID=48699 RepID=A0A3B3UFE4_9TELE
MFSPDAPRTTVLSVTPSETVEGSSVTLTCSSDANPAAKYDIYRVNEGQHGQLLRTEIQSVFSSIQVSDTGRYYCTAGNDLGSQTSPSIDINVKLNVYLLFLSDAPKVPSVSISPSGDIMEGNSVTLTCSSDANPAANYTWYRGKDKKPMKSNKNLIFNSINSNDSGQYYCTATNTKGQNNSRVNVDVKYAPRSPSVSLSPSGDIMKGSSVTLTCSSDANPAANYSWYKEGEKAPKASEKSFTITNIQNEHNGNYYCKVQNKIGWHNATVTVNVVAGKLSLMYILIGTIPSILLIMIFLLVLISR